MSRPADAKPRLVLSLMPQQQGLRSSKEDWTGVISRTERRKLQNRLNQRRHRMRSRGDASTQPVTPTDKKPKAKSTDVFDIEPLETTHKAVFHCPKAPPNALHIHQSLQIEARRRLLQGSPNADHLLGLTRLNVHRAIIDNIQALGMTPDWMESDDALSIFNVRPLSSYHHVPACLQPTAIQLHLPHHPWLDFFPFPRMRDLLILAGNALDDDDLCHDLMAFWDTRNTGATLLVWGNSWEPENWEASEAFVNKWAWLLATSPELLRSTNRWRASRGERSLIWKDILTKSHPVAETQSG